MSPRRALEPPYQTPAAIGVAGPGSRGTRLVSRAHDLDRFMAQMLRPLALPSLRIVLGLVFIWFGALKVAGVSPVKSMVAGTIPWVNPNLVVPGLGGVEVILGLGLITGVGLRLALPILAGHLAGTFLTFVMLPGQMFLASDPLVLTAGGEFVLKNLVLISATLVLIVHTSRRAPEPAKGSR